MAHDIATVKARIEALADACVATLLTGEEQVLARSRLPAVEARPGAATNARNGAFGRLVTREWQLWFFGAEITTADDHEDTLAALEACYPYLEPIPDYFKDRPNLQDVNKTGGIVYGTSLMDDSGPRTSPYKGKEYAVIRFTFNVITQRN